MEEHLRRSDRLISLGVLAAGIAHEIRNPLTGISLLMDDLHDHMHDLPRERELIRKSLQEIDRLENLINGLLDFAAPSKQIKLELRPLADVLLNTLFLVKKLCENNHISLLMNSQSTLPMLLLDPEKLQQALLNLLMNAIQAMPEGGDLRVEVKKVSAAESLLSMPAVRIAVQDTGRGISPGGYSICFRSLLYPKHFGMRSWPVHRAQHRSGTWRPNLAVEPAWAGDNFLD